LRDISEAIDLSEQIKTDIAYISQYYSFMTKLLDKVVKLYEAYCGRLSDSLRLIWLLICYMKKTVLKRKNDNNELLLLTCVLIDELLRLVGHNNDATFDKYLKTAGLTDNEAKVSSFRGSVKALFDSFDNKDFLVNMENTYLKLKERYYDVLIPDELDDILIYETHMKLKKQDSKESLTPFKTLSSTKMTYDEFIKSLDGYINLDISYLSIKVLKNNYCDFTYKELYEEFESEYIEADESMAKLLQKGISYNKHKSMFLKLSEEYLNKNQAKLTEKQFHRNVLVISFYVYCYLQFIEDKLVLNNFIYLYSKGLNKYAHFEGNSIMLILISLNDTSIPNNIKLILKSLYNTYLSYILWQKDSKFVAAVWDGEAFSNENKVSLMTFTK
jgi:hypothetical protein